MQNNLHSLLLLDNNLRTINPCHRLQSVSVVNRKVFNHNKINSSSSCCAICIVPFRKMSFVAPALGAFLTYAMVSTFFWHYPNLIHKKKRVPFLASHISHRGGSGEGYENTLRAFRSAIANGTDMLELDVRLTKDAQVVVFHDESLTRMTGRNLKVADVEYKELPTISKTVPIDTMPGHKFCDTTWSEDDRRIPLLRDVFSQFSDVPMNIDIKIDDGLLIQKVSQLLDDYNRKEITVWGSFNNQVCQKLGEISPQTLQFFSPKRVIIVIFCAVIGLLPFIPIRETHYEVFLPLSMRRRMSQSGRELSRTESILWWICGNLLVWKPLISHLRRRGIHVYFWVCNSDDEYAMCQSIGANGIMTDKPCQLRTFLDKRN